MTIKSSGKLSLSEIMDEFGWNSAPYGLNEYYRGGGNVPNISSNNAISTSGVISIGMFYGAKRQAPPGSLIAWSQQYFTVPDGHSILHVKMCGGGGGGESGWGNYDGAGGAGAGGSAGAIWTGDIAVTSGESLLLTPGAGGYGGGPSHAIYVPGGGEQTPFGYYGQTGGNSTILRVSNGQNILNVAGGAGGNKAWGGGNYANGQGYNPAVTGSTPIYDEFGTYLGDVPFVGSWHHGWAGLNLGLFDGNYYSGGARGDGGPDGSYYTGHPTPNGKNGALGSGGGGGASSNYNPNDAQGWGGNGGQGVIIVSWG